MTGNVPSPVHAVEPEGHKPAAIIFAGHEFGLAIHAIGETFQLSGKSCDGFGDRVGARATAPTTSAYHGFKLHQMLIDVDDGYRDFVR